MKYISLDIETTSLIPYPDHVLEIAMVLEDSTKPQPVENLPTYHSYVYKEDLGGQLYALHMNAGILGMLASLTKTQKELVGKGGSVPAPNGAQIQLEGDMWDSLNLWLQNARESNNNKRLVLAGKNVRAFDYLFLPRKIQDHFLHRSIDVGSVYLDWSKDAPPSMRDILGEDPPHTALADARAVISMLRHTYTREPHVYRE